MCSPYASLHTSPSQQQQAHPEAAAECSLQFFQHWQLHHPPPTPTRLPQSTSTSWQVPLPEVWAQAQGSSLPAQSLLLRGLRPRLWVPLLAMLKVRWFQPLPLFSQPLPLPAPWHPSMLLCYLISNFIPSYQFFIVNSLFNWLMWFLSPAWTPTDTGNEELKFSEGWGSASLGHPAEHSPLLHSQNYLAASCQGDGWQSPVAKRPPGALQRHSGNSLLLPAPQPGNLENWARLGSRGGGGGEHARPEDEGRSKSFPWALTFSADLGAWLPNGPVQTDAHWVQPRLGSPTRPSVTESCLHTVTPGMIEAPAPAGAGKALEPLLERTVYWSSIQCALKSGVRAQAPNYFIIAITVTLMITRAGRWVWISLHKLMCARVSVPLFH